MSYNRTLGPTDTQYLNGKVADLSDATSGYVTTKQLSAYTPTSGFSTINGSSITSGGNITISGGSQPVMMPIEINVSGENTVYGEVTGSTELAFFADLYSNYSGNPTDILFDACLPIIRLGSISDIFIKCTAARLAPLTSELYLGFSYMGKCLGWEDYEYAYVNIYVCINGNGTVTYGGDATMFDTFNFS